MSRRFMSLRVLVLLMLASGALPTRAGTAPEPLDAPDAAALARMESELVRYVESGERAGIQWAVSHRGRIVSSGAVGWRDVGARAPLQETTQFRIYSMTRAMTALLGLRLVERGLLELDAPLGRYLPEFADARVLVRRPDGSHGSEPAPRPIRVRDLFTYTAGLGYAQHYPAEFGVRSDDIVGPRISTEQGIRRLAALPLLHPPGERWRYGWSGDVTGRLIEVVTGERLDVHFSRHLLDPLGMTQSGFVTTPDRLSRVYGPQQDGVLPDVTDRALQLGSWLEPGLMHSGGGGLLSTARDYLRFCELLAGGGQRGDVRILGTDLARQMMTSQLTPTQGPLFWYEAAPGGLGPDPGSWGLGIGVRERTRTSDPVGLEGEVFWGGLAGTGYFCHPGHGIAAVVMTQHLGPGGDDPTLTLRRGVYDALGLLPRPR